MAKATTWTDTDTEVRKRGEQTGLDTLVVHALIQQCQCGRLEDLTRMRGRFQRRLDRGDKPFHFGTPKFEASAIISLILVVLVIMTEATGNIIAIHYIV